MIKKKIIYIIIVFSYISTFSIWQESFQNTWNIEKIIPIPLWNDISHINTRFCNDWFQESKLTNELSLKIRPWEEKEICVIHFNTHDQDIYLRWAFADYTIEPNWNMVCGTDHTRNNTFSKFMKPFQENFIKVPAKWSVLRKTTIKFPIWINWLQKACFARWISPWELTEWEMILFVIRKINNIQILVEWKHYKTTDKIKDFLLENIIYILLIIISILLILEIIKFKKSKKPLI